MSRNVVVVGAGAVGAVYALFLKRGGARVTFLVRPKYVDDVKAGLRMWSGDREEMLHADRVVGSAAELKGEPVDQVWLCVPLTGVSRAWMTELLDATGDALVVDLVPDASGETSTWIPDARRVDGIIPFISYQTPLPNLPADHKERKRAPGIAYWLPPGAPTQLSGARAQHAFEALAAGGMAAKRVADARKVGAVGGAVFSAVIARLEASGWKLSALRRDLGSEVAEAVAASSRAIGASPFPFSVLARPPVTRLVLWLAEKVAPLPLEPYLEYHFKKVGAQMHQNLRTLVDVADKVGEPAPRLRALHHQLSGPEAALRAA